MPPAEPVVPPSTPEPKGFTPNFIKSVLTGAQIEEALLAVVNNEVGNGDGDSTTPDIPTFKREHIEFTLEANSGYGLLGKLIKTFPHDSRELVLQMNLFQIQTYQGTRVDGSTGNKILSHGRGFVSVYIPADMTSDDYFTDNSLFDGYDATGLGAITKDSEVYFRYIKNINGDIELIAFSDAVQVTTDVTFTGELITMETNTNVEFLAFTEFVK